jgi:hypothetical protein
MLNLICLLDLDADPNTIDTRLDKNPFILVSRNCKRIQKDFRGGVRFYFRNVMSLGCLGCKVRKA